MRTRIFLFNLFFVAGSFSCVGGRADTFQDNVRSYRPIGVYATLWGEPFPSLVGANLSYNVYDFARVSAGIGSDSTDRLRASTMGVGMKLFVPSLPLSPTVGLHWAADSARGDTPRTLRDVPRGGS